jgi:hypothetical protein
MSRLLGGYPLGLASASFVSLPRMGAIIRSGWDWQIMQPDGDVLPLMR